MSNNEARSGCEPTRWYWLGSPSSNGLMRVLAAMQESNSQDHAHAAAAASDAHGAQQAPQKGIFRLILN